MKAEKTKIRGLTTDFTEDTDKRASEFQTQSHLLLSVLSV